MLALRFNIPGEPAPELLKEFSAYESCGAQATIDNEGQSVIVQMPSDKVEIILHCLEGKLDERGKAMLEHAMSFWDFQYNLALDSLAEQGRSKQERETQQIAEDMAYSAITGNVPPPEEFKLGSDNSVDRQAYLIAKIVPETVIERGGEFNIDEAVAMQFQDDIDDLLEDGIFAHTKNGYGYIFTNKGVDLMSRYYKSLILDKVLTKLNREYRDYNRILKEEESKVKKENTFSNESGYNLAQGKVRGYSWAIKTLSSMKPKNESDWEKAIDAINNRLKELDKIDQKYEDMIRKNGEISRGDAVKQDNNQGEMMALNDAKDILVSEIHEKPEAIK